MAKLTDRQCQTAKAEGKDVFLSDGGGLYLRVRPGVLTTRVWLFRYKRLEGTGSRWFELGTYPDRSLAQARAEAAELSLKRRAGIDPIAEREAAEAAARRAAELAQAAEAARITVQALFERWQATDLIRHRDGGAYASAQVRRHILPSLGPLLVEAVSKAQITAVTDTLLAAGKVRTAKVALNFMRQMFRFAVDRGVISSDPTVSIRKSSIGGPDTERDRFLSEAEIRQLAVQVPLAGLQESSAIGIWLILATGVRVGELLAARWADVDLGAGEWRIPQTKNGRPHTVYLSDFASSKFRELQQFWDERRNRAGKKGKTVEVSEWCFPRLVGSGPVCPKTLTKQVADRQRMGVAPMKGRAGSAAVTGSDGTTCKVSESLVLPGGPWRPHDLRRTFATLAVSLGVIPEVAEKSLNHTEQNRIQRTYQRHNYEREMREAWQLVGARLELLTSESGNVVTLSRSA